MRTPYAGLNDQRYTPLSDKACQFAGTFFADNAMLSREYVEITFLGLDTICEIICNGAVPDRVNNMHCAYTYDLKPHLVAGENVLLLKFSSPTRFFRGRNKRHYLWSGDDCIPGASHLRKALCMAGWDWGPQLPDMGIFRPVEIRAYDQDKIEDVQVLQFHEEDSVRLEIGVTTRHHAWLDLYAEIDGQKILLENGQGTVVIRNPRLWWARGYGELHLYDLQVTMELFLEDDVLTVNVSNETMADFKGSVRIRFCKNDFTVVEEHTAKVSVKKLVSSDVLSVGVPEMDRYGSYAVVSPYGPDDAWITDRTQMFVKPKHYGFANPNIRAAITDVPGGVEITLQADCFARAVEIDFAGLDCPLPDNFFDLTDGEVRVLRMETDYSARELEDNLILRSVWDIGYNR